MIEKISAISKLRKRKDKKLKFLVVRPDRIGDVVLSTPVIDALKRAYPGSEIHFLAQDFVIPVLRHHHNLDRVIVYRPNTNHFGILGFFRLVQALRREKYDVAITLQVNFKVSFAIFLAGIKYRIGPYSKIYSFLFFNKGMRQNRSMVAMHEADYNLMLLRKFGIKTPTRVFNPHIVVDADAKERMRKYVQAQGIEDNKKMVVIHPGMGGSALNWPYGYYADLARRCAQEGFYVYITGAFREKELVAKVVEEAMVGLELEQKQKIKAFIGENSDTGLSNFIALLSLAQVVVAPSTGPLHIAVALGKKTVSLYPPIKVQSAIRWGPYYDDDSKHVVFVPEALCGQDFKCIGQKCPFYYCMERISVEDVFEAVKNHCEGNQNL
jgi:lipopolysaccharide heptosyltransferase II